MASSTVENYLKQLYLERQRRDQKLVGMGRLAEIMTVTPATATAMVKLLAKSGYVKYQPRTGSTLTSKGETLAIQVLRRHRLLELFLVKVLDFDWSEVHDEAERLEHAISEKLLQRIDDYMGHPLVDPHGDPIPSADGEVIEQRLISLATCHPNQKVKIVRIVEQDRDFLLMAHRHHLVPGNQFTILVKDALAEAITIQSQNPDETITLGIGAAAKIMVETYQ